MDWSAEVNGTKTKSLRTGREMPHRQQKNRARSYSLPGYKCLSIGAFSDDFAAVDFREELCYHSLPKKAQIQSAIWYIKKKNNDYFKSEKKIPSQNSLLLTNKFDWVSCGGVPIM